MMDVLRRTTLAVRTDPLEDPTPQTVMPWAEVLAFLPHLEALAEAGTAFQLGETPGHVAGIVADVPAAPATAATARRARRAAAKAWGRTRRTAWWA